MGEVVQALQVAADFVVGPEQVQGAAGDCVQLVVIITADVQSN
jgi:hypothetical protein